MTKSVGSAFSFLVTEEVLIQHRKRRHKVPRLRRIAEKRQFCFARDDSKELVLTKNRLHALIVDVDETGAVMPWPDFLSNHDGVCRQPALPNCRLMKLVR